MKITYKYLQETQHQAVYLNDKLIGQMFKMNKNSKPNIWSAVPECTKLRPKSICAEGFRSRRYAVNFLLKWSDGGDE